MGPPDGAAPRPPPAVGAIGCYGVLRMGRVVPVGAVVCWVAGSGLVGVRLIGWEELLPDPPAWTWDRLTDDHLYRADVPVSPLLQVGCWTPGPPGTGEWVSDWYQPYRPS